MKLLTEQIISVASAVAIVGLFMFLVHLPQKHRLRELDDQMQTQQESLALAKQGSSSLVPLNQRVQALRRAVAEFDKRLPDRSQLGACLEQIVANLKSTHLASQEIRPNSPTTRPCYSELPVSMRFQGSFTNICTFLNNIEKITHLTRVKELQLEADRKGPAQIRAKMVLNIYCNRS